MEKFERMGMISTEPFGRSFSRISVLKYDEYQPENRPIKSLESANETPHTPRLPEQFEPTEGQRKAKDNELLTNNSISKDIECATPAIKQVNQKQRLSCEEVWKTLQELVPDARGWNALTPARRKLIQKFWMEAKPIAKQLGDVNPFGMESFREYLSYLHTSCRWMFETRPDSQTGKTWRKKNYEYILSAEIYAQVREGERDDR